MKKRSAAFLSTALLAVAILAPAALAAPGGAPAAHGASGKDFGKAVSGLAKMDPMALAAHVSGR
jgi:hypothetical protein